MLANRKRQRILNFLNLKLKKEGIFFIQEAHCTPETEEEWKKSWDGDLFFSHGKSNSTGVVTGFTKNFDIDIKRYRKTIMGAFL